jgi:hypothetical protein
MLTGSASKGRYNHYYYYHCVSSCGCRFRTENANSLFVRELRKYVPKPGMSDIYVVTLKESYNEQTRSQQSDRKQIISQIDDLGIRLRNARELVADQKLDPEDYRELKLDCTNKITILEAKLAGSSQAERNIDGLLDQTVSNLSRLDTLMKRGQLHRNVKSLVRYIPKSSFLTDFNIEPLD